MIKCKMSSLGLGLLLLAALFPLRVDASEQSVQVSSMVKGFFGTITDSQGKPFAGAEIELVLDEMLLTSGRAVTV